MVIQKISLEDVVARLDASEEQQIAIFENQQSAGTTFGVISEVLLNTIADMQADNALVKECLEREEIMF